jgi:cation:H+ antiporter
MTTWVEVPLALFAAILLLLLTNDSPPHILSRAEGISLLCLFGIFIFYTFALAKFGGAGNGEEITIKNYSIGKSCIFILLGLVGLIIGGRMLVYGAVHIAQNIGISERIIGLTIVSIGTSLPELATSIIAARKNNADIAIGNVVGSNIFNTFLILGATATITPLDIPQGSSTDLLVNITASALLFLFIFTGSGRKINRWEGGILLLLYLAYLALILFKP